MNVAYLLTLSIKYFSLLIAAKMIVEYDAISGKPTTMFHPSATYWICLI